ncbi:MAG: PKD domain-containing protein [Gaiellaceae bacterium]
MARRRKSWRFRLDEATTLEVSTAAGLTEKQVRRRGRWSLVLGTVIATVGLVAVAHADNFQNDVVVGGNDTITAGGSTTITYRLVANSAPGGDIGSCNVDPSNKATVTITTPIGVTANPTSFQFEACGNTGAQSAIFSSSAVGSHSITHTITGGKTAALYNNQANWTLKVNAAANADPTADAGGPYTGDEGDHIALDGTGSADTDGSIASYSWTVTPQSGGGNDPDSGASCSFVDSTSSTDSEPKVACTDDGVYDIALTVTDDDGASDDDSTTLTLANANPSATANIPGGNVNEGDSFNLSLSSPADPGSNDTFTYQFDCGDGAGYNAASTTAGRSCPTTDNGSRSVKLKILDDDGGFTEYTGTVTVVNVAPTVTAAISASINCQTNATLTLGFSDSGVNDGPWAVDIDWGDGSPHTTFNAATQGAQANQTHLYTTPGSYYAIVTITDKDGAGNNGQGVDNNNPITVNQTYTVDFLPPFDDSSPSGLIVNKMKNGRVVPVKATIHDDCTQAYLTGSGANVTIKVNKAPVSGTGGDAVEEYADAGQSSAGTNLFRWTSDPSAPGGGFWIYNLDSGALGLSLNTGYRVDIYVGAVKATMDEWALLMPVK